MAYLPPSMGAWRCISRTAAVFLVDLTMFEQVVAMRLPVVVAHFCRDGSGISACATSGSGWGAGVAQPAREAA